MQENSEIEVWGGIEYTLNRVGDQYHDQLEYTGHYYRDNDINTIAGLGIKTFRYPVLWERHQPQKDTSIDWSFSEKKLLRLKAHGIKPIVGLVHHGSGPKFVNFFDASFEKGLASYASTVAEKFPWIEYYTPVNEPLTTARFCGLYGHWYPHRNDEHSFYTILLSECRATVKAMQAIRQVNPNAKLIQTEDLGKTYSTPLLQYQAKFDNHRSWLTFDLLCGKVDEQHPLWNYLTTTAQISPADLHYFLENNCPPDICGLNYYMTSERYLDEEMEKYPHKYHSGNGRHNFADVERVRVDVKENFGAKILLQEAYNRLHLPIAITECHLHCTRDEQMRWFGQMWQIAHELKSEGIDIRAVTAWALFGTYGWDKLMMEPGGTYETGAFKVTTGYPEPTVFAKMLQTLSAGKVFKHPMLKQKGWWQRDIRLFSGITEALSTDKISLDKTAKTLLIIGEDGVLSKGLEQICYERNMPFVFINKQHNDSDTNGLFDKLLTEYKPWAVVCIEGYEGLKNETSAVGTHEAAYLLAAACKKREIKFVRFSPEPLVQNESALLYPERNGSSSLSVYQSTPTKQEDVILKTNSNALLIRTGTLYSPWDDDNIITRTIDKLQHNDAIEISGTHYSSFAYLPDVVHIGLDWLIDDESGVYYMANSYHVCESYVAFRVADILGKESNLVNVINSDIKPLVHCIQLLPMDRRIKLPLLEDAIKRYTETVKEISQNLEPVPA